MSLQPPQRTPDPGTPTTTLRSAEMPLLDHLRELRKRLLLSVVAISIAACVAYVYSEEVFYILCKPYFDAFSDGTLIGTGPADAFILKLKLAAVMGAILSSPFLFYQIWLFISPGLLPDEKKLAIPFIFFSTLLFSIGIYFCYAVVLPFAFEFFFEQYKTIKITPTVRITEHIEFMAKAVLSFGCVFEVPILAFFLGRVGVITSRMLISGFRYAIVIIFIVSAIMTPPDVLTQFLMAGPLLILYGLSILVVRFTEKNRTNEQ